MDVRQHCEVPEMKRSFHQALTRLHAAAMKEFDAIASLEAPRH